MCKELVLFLIRSKTLKPTINYLFFPTYGKNLGAPNAWSNKTLPKLCCEKLDFNPSLAREELSPLPVSQVHPREEQGLWDVLSLLCH